MVRIPATELRRIQLALHPNINILSFFYRRPNWLLPIFPPLIAGVSGFQGKSPYFYSTI